MTWLIEPWQDILANMPTLMPYSGVPSCRLPWVMLPACQERYWLQQGISLRAATHSADAFDAP